MPTIKSKTNCPTCGVECKIGIGAGGSHYYIPAQSKFAAELLPADIEKLKLQSETKALEDKKIILADTQFTTPYEKMLVKLKELHYQLLIQSSETEQALSNCQQGFEEQIAAVKKQLLRQSKLHVLEQQAADKRFNEMVMNYTNIIEDLNKKGKKE